MRYTVAEIKEIVAGLAAQYGADRIYLFGSYARGDADQDSDIDLRIDKGAIRGLQLGVGNPRGFDSHREPGQQVFEFYF